MPLDEHYAQLQEQQVYEFAYFLVQNLEGSDQNDQQTRPPTPPPSAPSSQLEAAAVSGAGLSSSQEAVGERREADRRSLARILDMERLEEERARRARAAAVKKVCHPWMRCWVQTRWLTLREGSIAKTTTTTTPHTPALSNAKPYRTRTRRKRHCCPTRSTSTPSSGVTRAANTVTATDDATCRVSDAASAEPARLDPF